MVAAIGVERQRAMSAKERLADIARTLGSRDGDHCEGVAVGIAVLAGAANGPGDNVARDRVALGDRSRVVLRGGRTVRDALQLVGAKIREIAAVVSGMRDVHAIDATGVGRQGAKTVVAGIKRGVRRAGLEGDGLDRPAVVGEGTATRRTIDGSEDRAEVRRGDFRRASTGRG
ncbi:MAG TPA: hypothetical protein VFX03_16865, partial [Thermomicrobiales bacterium]|nr:hypothetical protein [Thermomicrobiales bacterium]